MNLYESIKAAGIETSCWQSDLYFPVTEESREILSRFPLQKGNATTFKNNIDGKLWYDVPFAYIPFWEAAERASNRKETL